MATTSSTALRRIAGVAFTLLLFCLCLSMEAQGQGTSPIVTATVTTGLDHPAGWGTLLQTAVDQQGDWLVVDWSKGGLYMFPAGGGPAVTLIPQPALGGYQNPGIAIDSENTLYLEGNWSNCLLRFPYDPATKKWPGLDTFNNNNPTSNCPAPYNWAQYGYVPWNWGFQPWGLAVDQSNNIWIANQVSGNFAFKIPLSGSGASATPGKPPVELVNTMNKRASSAAVDPWGNFYFTEQLSDSPKYPGVLMLPAGQSGVADETGLTRVDPNLPKPVGVVADPLGNLYVSDNSANDKPETNFGGTYLVPNVDGTPDPSKAIRLTNAVGQGAGAIDWSHHILYVPTTTKQSNGMADVAAIYFGAAEGGSSPVGTAVKTPITVGYSFHGVVSESNPDGSVTPASFAIIEDGVATPDFSITGGTCAPDTAYKPGDSCSEVVTFNPTSTGSLSAKLVMLDAQKHVLASTLLHGTGLAANIQASWAMESAIGEKLSTPSQIAADTLGNIYVADPGQKQVLMYAAGSSGAPVSIGTGLTSPTGVAVDPAGDVFIADSGNGEVYEVPFATTGLNTAGQITLASKLGANLRLAIDGPGNLYVADPANARVLKLGNLGASGPGILGQTNISLTAGFTAPSGVAVDSNSNLYVIDGANLFELHGGQGAPATLLNNLSGAVGLAVDASGAVYLASDGGTQRIPQANGVLDSAHATTIAAGVTNPAGVALDNMGNIYLLDATAGNVHVVNTSGKLDFGTLASTSASATQTVTLTNNGNAPLTVTGFTSTNGLDYTAADVNCETAPIAAGGTCQFTITLNPGAGEEGTLTGQIGITSNAGNVAVISTTGVGAALDKSTSTISVGNSAEVVGTPVTVTVKPASGEGVPTGQVTISFTTTTGSTGKVTQTLTNGSATVTLAPAHAGSQKFIVDYQGDRTYGRSSGNSTAPIAKSAATIAMPTNPPSFLPYVLQQNGSTPYDGSVQYWQYPFQVTVGAAAGQPTGHVQFNDDSSTTGYKGQACPQDASGMQVVGTSGLATFPTQCLPMPQNQTYTPMVSSHTITPVYQGDDNYLGFTGTPTTFIVVRSPAVQIAADHDSLTLSSGGSATANLTLTSVLGYGYAGKGGLLNNYDFPVALACDNLPPHSQCSFTYPNPAPAIWNAVNSVYMPCTGKTQQDPQCATGVVTVTINSNVSVGTTTSRLVDRSSAAYAALFGFGMIGLVFRRRVSKAGRLMLMVFLSIVGGALAVSLTACSTTNLSPESILTTPKGSYAVTVTAQQVGHQCIGVNGGNSNCTTAAGLPGKYVNGSNDQVSLPYTINVTVQ